MGVLDWFRGRRRRQERAVVPADWAAAGMPRFAVVDVETTGLRAATDRVVEVAVVTTDLSGRVLDEWSTRVNPQAPIGVAASRVHGITDAHVAGAPVFEEVIGLLNPRLQGAAVVAHHAAFDMSFLRAEYQRVGWEVPHLPMLCTLEASRHHLPSLDRRRLMDCCQAVGTSLNGAHSALGDARATAGLLSAFMHPGLGVTPLPEHLHLPHQALAVAWPSGPTARPVQRRTTTPSHAGRGTMLSGRAAVNLSKENARAPLALVQQFSLIDAVDEGAPASSVTYLEKLAEVLEDGEVTTSEAAGLEALAETEGLSAADVQAANSAFVLALAYAALNDGKVTRAERAELQAVSDLLGVDKKTIPGLLESAERARHNRLSAHLKDLPTNWVHGEPLRVGDKVVFTGCEAHQRDELEARSEALGVRVLCGVSTKVTLLVSDATMDGTKIARARELGTRIIHPTVYRELLEYLQPALARPPKPPAGAAARSTAQQGPGRGTTHPVAMATVHGGVKHVGPSPAQVRSWARANGIEVGTRGRLPKELVESYLAAHPNT